MSWFADVATPAEVVASARAVPGALPRTSLVSNKAFTPTTKKTRVHEERIKVKTAWSTAFAPLKSLFLNMFVSYMSGSGLQILTITMTFYMFFVTPFQQLRSAHAVFSPLSSKATKRDVHAAELVYILCNLAAVAFGLYKVNAMGILPTRPADWVPFEEPTKYYLL